MGLTVVTHTRGNRPEYLRRCQESVAADLPAGATHLVIHTEELMAARWHALTLDDVVCFVDDDDIVVNSSVSRCYQLLQQQDLGLVYTGEAETDAEGNVVSEHVPVPMPVAGITLGPRVVHHLAMFRTAAVRDECWDLYRRFNAGLEWFMRVSAAASGIACIPIVGYHWRQHDANHSRTSSWDTVYRERQWEMALALRPWITVDAVIPHW